MYMISPITSYVGAPLGIAITVITAGGVFLCYRGIRRKSG